MTTPLRWHLPSNSSPSETCCGLEMPDQRKGSGIPMCGDCIAGRLGPLMAEGPREHARQKYGDPKLRRKK